MKTNLLILFGFLVSMNSFGQDEVLNLYQETVPESKQSAVGENKEIYKGEIARVSKVSSPTISVYNSNKGDEPHAAVLICPGGGYSYLSFTHEGVNLAEWFNEIGITGVVLKSRLPDDELMTNKADVPLMDAQRAMELIRENAKKWNIDPDKVGVMGFSAGGHLAASLSTHFDSLQRPDFSMLIYPVITMNKNFTHMGSREALLGEEASSEDILKYSNEKQVSENTPSAFLVHSVDDHVVPFRNSLAYYEALSEKGVRNSELHVFQNGGHGFGVASGKSGNVADWLKLLEGWLRKNNWIEHLEN